MVLSNLNLLAAAPGGVARLRELILTLAVQGKLVPQDPKDEPASALLRKIRAEKDRLIADGKIKRDKPLAEIDDDEKVFGLPIGWEWVRLGDLCSYIQRGKGPVYADHSEHRVISQKCVRWYGLNLEPARFVTAESLTKYEAIRFLQAGDLLWNSTGTGTIGRACLVPPAQDKAGLVADSHVTVVRPLQLNGWFLWRWIQSPYVQNEIEGSASGTTNQIELNTSTVINHLVPVPPLAEQSRIITRVEELMRLCDALEAKGRLEATQHAQLVSTLLGTLTDSETPEQLADNWQRIATHFDLLLDRPQAIDALEQTILQLAVRGLLVPQDPQDEPARELLKKIRAEKDKLIADGKIKRDKALPPIAAEKHPFILPQGWAWGRFPDVCAISGGATPSKAIPQNWEGSIPWVSPKDMKVPRIADAQDHVSDAAVRGSLSLIPSGSLLMVVRGMILAHSFPVAETLAPVTINQDMKALTPFEPEVLSFLTLLCRGMKSEILALIDRSTHGTCKLESPKIFGMLIPLPPLAEQSRIVSRVAQLRHLCADLRQRLSVSQATQAHLAEALVQQIS